ncbi:hypothetical protein BJ742DRAFT_87041 [Cladochytrium replicatum]|nr:hypothetical protein BJ742DRAFT_87041 [Cladochytrium replicatum]
MAWCACNAPDTRVGMRHDRSITEACDGPPQENRPETSSGSFTPPTLRNGIRSREVPPKETQHFSKSGAISNPVPNLVGPPFSLTGATARWNTTSKEKWIRFSREPVSIYIPPRGKVTDLLPPLPQASYRQSESRESREMTAESQRDQITII